ncbi:hypothetical protein CFAM422_008522 [Trichoderma lentiforme]|uniref:Transmembrane protein n=1 Tax=Trichoderma lentiforme TaxID=1567552 RepID=A0A9P4XB95_9HYPO|nr:hypothetical protein CFAM422_008522 [Trichoderma lentiforme]
MRSFYASEPLLHHHLFLVLLATGAGSNASSSEISSSLISTALSCVAPCEKLSFVCFVFAAAAPLVAVFLAGAGLLAAAVLFAFCPRLVVRVAGFGGGGATSSSDSIITSSSGGSSSSSLSSKALRPRRAGAFLVAGAFLAGAAFAVRVVAFFVAAGSG